LIGYEFVESNSFALLVSCVGWRSSRDT